MESKECELNVDKYREFIQTYIKLVCIAIILYQSCISYISCNFILAHV